MRPEFGRFGLDFGSFRRPLACHGTVACRSRPARFPRPAGGGAETVVTLPATTCRARRPARERASRGPTRTPSPRRGRATPRGESCAPRTSSGTPGHGPGGAAAGATALRDRIARSIFEAGHHTTLQHAHFQFALSGVSRQFLWTFLHSHPFYNSEQVSQRYVEVKAERVVRAPARRARPCAVFRAPRSRSRWPSTRP